jgi:DNA polymerase-3 subunit beta
VGAIIPTKAINELARILSGDEKGADVLMGFTENQVTFQYKGIVIISRLIEGNFPSFDQVIPKTHDIQLKLKSRQILQATQRAAVGTMDRGGSVRFSLAPGRLQISASAQGRIEVESEIEVDYKGEPFAIAFNPAYLVDVFKALEAEEILLGAFHSAEPRGYSPGGRRPLQIRRHAHAGQLKHRSPHALSHFRRCPTPRPLWPPIFRPKRWSFTTANITKPTWIT